MRGNVQAVYYQTRFALLKHWKLRIVTNELRKLTDAAEAAINDDSFRNLARLAGAIGSARMIIDSHGYTPAPKINLREKTPSST